MLVFVTSLRHPDNAADYAQVERLFARTLRSLERQTDDDRRLVLVAHRPPPFRLPDWVEYVEVDFPPPAKDRGVHAGRAAFVRDKGTKIGLGLVVARRWSPDYAMVLDADDLVSARLTAFVNASVGVDGWYVRTGYRYSAAREVYRVQPDFNRRCGSCHVVGFDHFGVPDLPHGASQTQLVDAFGERLTRVLGAHRHGLEAWAEWGVRLRPLPFRGVAYTVEAGENHSSAGLGGLALPVTRRFTADFGVVRSRPFLAAAADGVSVRAASETLRSLGRRAGAVLRGVAPSAPEPTDA